MQPWLFHRPTTRRRFLLASLAATVVAPRIAKAQSSNRPVVGFLNGASAALSENYVRPFRRGLEEVGYVEGRNVTIEYRWADGHYDRLPALATDLVRRGVNVIAATSTPTGLPAKRATTTIPIVFVTGSDPVEQGLVASFNRPGGNLTGATTLAVGLGQKRMELIHASLPKVATIALLVNPSGPNLTSVMREAQAAARALGVTLHVLHASAVGEVEPAVASVRKVPADALVIGTDTFFNSQSARLAELTVRHAVPATYQYREFAAAGGLMSYGGSITDAYHVAGVYTGRVLNGEKPADLPVQQSRKAELYVDVKTAKALGVTIPQSLLLRADEIIQ